MLPDAALVTSLITEIADEEIVPRFDRLTQGDVREKAPGDLVTVVDLAVEARLTRALSDLLPGSLVLGEEAAAADPDLLAQLVQGPPVWVIDPIDGTANFAAGNRNFAVMVALVFEDQPIMSWIHDPLNRRTAAAAKGSGAWIGSTRLAVAPAEEPERMRGALLAGHFGDRALGRQIQSRRHLVTGIKSLRSAAHEYLRLAEGKVHFALFTRLMPWDHAAGVLLHQEAGGAAFYLDGGDYRASAIARSGLMLAPDPAAWSNLRHILIDPSSS